MNQQINLNSRLDFLDATRAFALLLGIGFHASLSFMPIFIGWAVMDINTSASVPTFVLISHSFRMEVFFLIAGFLAHMKFHKTDLKTFWQSRLTRIAIPFVIGWAILRPLVVSGWTMGGQSMQGAVDIPNAFISAFTDFNGLYNFLFVGTHLWFLYYLVLTTVICVVLRQVINQFKTVKSVITKTIESFVTWVCQSLIGVIVVSMLTAGCLWFMSNWGVDTPDKSLIPEFPVLLLYFSFFIFGWMLHRKPELLLSFSQLTWSKVFLCIVTIIATIKLSSYQMLLSHSHYIWIKVGYMLSYALMMWLLVAIFIGICRLLFSNPSMKIRYLSDASYWIYLIHLPIVIWLQIAVAELEMYWLVKFIIVCVGAIFISLVSYDLFVRNTFLGKLLNGKRKPRWLFNFQNKESEIAT